jgi:hypothetical protein
VNSVPRAIVGRWARYYALPALLVMGLTSAAQSPAAQAQVPQQQSAAAPTAKSAGKWAGKWVRVEVNLPTSPKLFPGEGSEVANSQCLMCHSLEMVTTQPALSLDEWTAEIGKMRTVYGAPLPADQVEALARYLHGINGR